MLKHWLKDLIMEHKDLRIPIHKAMVFPFLTYNQLKDAVSSKKDVAKV